MFRYYCFLGLRALKRNPALTALMIITLAIGVAASMSTLTILHVMSADPIPQKSDRLFIPILDNGPAEDYVPGRPLRDHQMSYRDAINLLGSPIGERRTALYPVAATIELDRTNTRAVDAEGLAITHDFFTMFDANFLYGQAWSAQEDRDASDVIVLSRKLAEKIYGKTDPTGKRLRAMGQDFLVVGVLGNWLPQPRFHYYNGPLFNFGFEDDYLMPLSSALRHEIRTSQGGACSRDPGPTWQGYLDSECTWLHFWVEMKSGSQRADLQNYLDSYTDEQRKLGRYMRHAKNEIFDVMQWLDKMKVVSNDYKLSVWLAFAFLLLCLVSTIGLLFAKLAARASEVGVRRALGASRRQIFVQFLIESSFIGLAGGMAGLLLAFAGLALISKQSTLIEQVAHMDWIMLGTTFLLSVSAAILAGLLPTWRACQITPAMQLKSQ